MSLFERLDLGSYQLCVTLYGECVSPFYKEDEPLQLLERSTLGKSMERSKGEPLIGFTSCFRGCNAS